MVSGGWGTTEGGVGGTGRRRGGVIISTGLPDDDDSLWAACAIRNTVQSARPNKMPKHCAPAAGRPAARAGLYILLHPDLQSSLGVDA